MGFRVNQTWKMDTAGTAELPTNVTIGPVEPTDPNEGDVWIDTASGS